VNVHLWTSREKYARWLRCRINRSYTGIMLKLNLQAEKVNWYLYIDLCGRWCYGGPSSMSVLLNIYQTIHTLNNHKTPKAWIGVHIHKCLMISVSNGSRYPPSGPGLDCKNRLVRFQTSPKTRPADSWWAKPRPVPVNPWVSPGVVRPVGPNLRSCV